jgi:hypothetical protein
MSINHHHYSCITTMVQQQSKCGGMVTESSMPADRPLVHLLVHKNNLVQQGPRTTEPLQSRSVNGGVVVRPVGHVGPKVGPLRLALVVQPRPEQNRWSQMARKVGMRMT